MKNQIKNLKEANYVIDQMLVVMASLEGRIEELEATPNKRDRGPESKRDMTIDDARRLILGDLKDISHKAAATQLGLSYGQVYSARGGYTFKKLQEEKLAKK